MAGTTVFQGTIWNTMKKVLDGIAQSTDDVEPKKNFMARIFEERSSDEAYETILEMAGPGLASVKSQGQEMATGALGEHTLTTYMHRTYAMRMIISEEAMDDTRYPKVLVLGRRLKRAANKTVQYDAANVLARGFNASYPIGDGLSLWNSAHTLESGNTFSNIMSTAQAPSLAALIEVETLCRKLVDHQGLIGAYMMESILCPVDQWAVWSGILNSSYNPEPGNFTEINVVNRDLNVKDVVANPYWTNTTTNWAVKTDCDEGFTWYWRKKPVGNTWVENSQLEAQHAISYRSSRGVTDPRATIGVNA